MIGPRLYRDPYADAYDPSGRRLAEQAHTTGAVLPPVETPRHTVTLELVIAGHYGWAETVAARMQALALELGTCESALTTVRPR